MVLWRWQILNTILWFKIISRRERDASCPSCAATLCRSSVMPTDSCMFSHLWHCSNPGCRLLSINIHVSFIHSFIHSCIHSFIHNSYWVSIRSILMCMAVFSGWVGLVSMVAVSFCRLKFVCCVCVCCVCVRVCWEMLWEVRCTGGLTDIWWVWHG